MCKRGGDIWLTYPIEFYPETYLGLKQRLFKNSWPIALAVNSNYKTCGGIVCYFIKIITANDIPLSLFSYAVTQQCKANQIIVERTQFFAIHQGIHSRVGTKWHTKQWWYMCVYSCM